MNAKKAAYLSITEIGQKLPEVLINDLELRFPVPEIKPTSTHNELLYQAGQAKVVQFLRDAYNAARKEELNHVHGQYAKRTEANQNP